MRKHIWFFMLLLLICNLQSVNAQDEFFHEIELKKLIVDNEKWEISSDANFKHIYTTPRWRRWGLSFDATRKFGNFRLQSGLNVFYTFNTKFSNFLELRPWLVAQLTIPLFDRLDLRQRIRSEWRFFFTEGDDARDNYARIRYQLSFDYQFSNDDEWQWKLRPFFELFFARGPFQFERFANETDYGLLVMRRLSKTHMLTFGYTLEALFEIDGNTGKGHTFFVGYSF